MEAVREEEVKLRGGGRICERGIGFKPGVKEILESFRTSLPVVTVFTRRS